MYLGLVQAYPNEVAAFYLKVARLDFLGRIPPKFEH